jgi:hypothetical protein
MTERIGESLKKIVRGAGYSGPVMAQRAFIANECRLACYRAVIELAMARPGLVASAVGISRASCKWQLESLSNMGLLEAWNVGGRIHYAPSGAISDAGLAEQLALALGKAGHRTILEALAKPGFHARSRAAGLRTLEKAGLVAIITDGKSRRVRPGSGLTMLSDVLAKGYSLHRRIAIDIIHRRAIPLELNPLRGGACELVLGGGNERHSVVLPSDPFGTALAARMDTYKKV